VSVWTGEDLAEWFGGDYDERDERMRDERREAAAVVKCDICGGAGTPDDPVENYGDLINPENAHEDCAKDAGWNE
jgi:hypothetical protein